MPIEWKDVQKWLSDTTNTAVKETKEIARKGKVQYDILTLRHQTTTALTELGSIAYELIQKGSAETLAADEKFKAVVERIRELELELRRKEEEKSTRKE
jgi:hypothetical protein